jgi:hypothetical protein
VEADLPLRRLGLEVRGGVSDLKSHEFLLGLRGYR